MSHRCVRFVNSLGAKDDRPGRDEMGKSISELMHEGWKVASSYPLWGGSIVYLEKRAEEQAILQAKPIAPSANAKPAAPAPNRPRKLKWKEERELETIEATILEAEDKVADLEKTFADPDFYKKHGNNYAALETDLKSARERVTELYHRWEELERIKNESTGSKAS